MLCLLHESERITMGDLCFHVTSVCVRVGSDRGPCSVCFAHLCEAGAICCCDLGGFRQSLGALQASAVLTARPGPLPATPCPFAQTSPLTKHPFSLTCNSKGKEAGHQAEDERSLLSPLATAALLPAIHSLGPGCHGHWGSPGGLACGAQGAWPAFLPFPFPAASPNTCSSGTGRWGAWVLLLTWEVATGSPRLSFPTCSQQDTDPDLSSTSFSQGCRGVARVRTTSLMGLQTAHM